MSDFFDELNNLVDDIIACKITKNEAKLRISEMKSKYGEDAFPSIYFQTEPKPWNKKYLQKLKEMNITGACSEEFLLHMAEVSEEIALKRKRVFIGAIILIIILAVLFMVLLMGNASYTVSSLGISVSIVIRYGETIVGFMVY